MTDLPLMGHAPHVGPVPLIAPVPLIGPVAAPGLQVMTYNIRRRMQHLVPTSPDRWATRKWLMRDLLRAERPTVLGTQEAMLEQARFVLDSLGPTYRRIGYGRGANKTGEGCPIFYDSERLALLDWSQQALSDAPHQPGSIGWGNWVPRIVVRAVFRDLATGAEFVSLNTHFDQRSQRARMKSADAIRRILSSSPLPTLITGDFNTDVGSDPHQRILVDGALVDTWHAATSRLSEVWGTFPNYGEPRHDSKRIDWILASSTIDVEQAAINLTRFGGAWPSDHAPVQAVVRIPAPAPRE